MADTHVGSLLILLKRDLDGNTPRPTLDNVDDLASLKQAYPDGFCQTPETTQQINGDEQEIVGQAPDGTVSVTETRMTKVKMGIEADVKDFTDKLMELQLGEGTEIRPGRTYKYWGFIADVNPGDKLRVEEGSPAKIKAKHLHLAYLNVTIMGDSPRNGQDPSNTTVKFTYDLTKPTWHGKELDGKS